MPCRALLCPSPLLCVLTVFAVQPDGYRRWGCAVTLRATVCRRALCGIVRATGVRREVLSSHQRLPGRNTGAEPGLCHPCILFGPCLLPNRHQYQGTHGVAVQDFVLVRGVDTGVWGRGLGGVFGAFSPACYAMPLPAVRCHCRVTRGLPPCGCSQVLL
jgi:hypothetical protein